MKNSKKIRYGAVCLDDFAQTPEERSLVSHLVHNWGTPFETTYERKVAKVLPKELVSQLKTLKREYCDWKDREHDATCRKKEKSK